MITKKDGKTLEHLLPLDPDQVGILIKWNPQTGYFSLDLAGADLTPEQMQRLLEYATQKWKESKEQQDTNELESSSPN